MSFEKLFEKIQQLFIKESIYYVGGAQTLPPPLSPEDEDNALIGLKNGDIEGYNISITLPDDGWVTVTGNTDDLKEIYDEIYQDGALVLEIETFNTDGTCHIRYYRNEWSVQR